MAQPFLTSIDSVDAWLAFGCLGDPSTRTIRPKKVMKPATHRWTASPMRLATRDVFEVVAGSPPSSWVPLAHTLV